MTRSKALEMLTSWGACQEGVDRVKGARTIKLMIARASLSDLEWVIGWIGGETRAAYNAATASARAAYDAAAASAQTAYDAATTSAWVAYNAATAPARDVYDAANASAWLIYDATIASSWAAYDAAIALARATYNAARLEIARTLITAYVGRAR